MPPRVATVDILLDQQQMTVDDLAEQANMPLDRAEAIALGRWTPAPAERQRIAAVFGVKTDDVCGLDPHRVLAIILARWTPSPKEREAIATALEVDIADITWGHKTPIQHIYGHGPG